MIRDREMDELGELQKSDCLIQNFYPALSWNLYDYLYLIKNYNSYQNELNFKQVFEKWLDFTKEKLSIFQKLTNTKNGNREI